MWRQPISCDSQQRPNSIAAKNADPKRIWPSFWRRRPHGKLLMSVCRPTVDTASPATTISKENFERLVCSWPRPSATTWSWLSLARTCSACRSRTRFQRELATKRHKFHENKSTLVPFCGERFLNYGAQNCITAFLDVCAWRPPEDDRQSRRT